MSEAELAAMDAEANAFAMELLMPAEWISRDAAQIDLCDEAAIAKLARKYRVPATVLAVRIGEVRASLALDASQQPQASPGNRKDGASNLTAQGEQS